MALTRELIGHFGSELAAFLTTFGNTPRQKPKMPPYARWSGPEEQKRWEESVEADLAREPTWGVLVRRLYTDELRYSRQILARDAGGKPEVVFDVGLDPAWPPGDLVSTTSASSPSDAA